MVMKIAFIGLGSIAKRHIRNLSEVLSERSVDYSIDVYRHGDRAIKDPEMRKLISNVFNEAELEQHSYDVIFITNPTALHYETVKRCVNQAKHLFIEKPAFDRTNVDISALKLKKDSVYYVACPLRYTAVLQYIKENVDLSSVYSVRAISSSYLPDWRPGTDYRLTYSAKKELGGGVAIDLIHEWDYLTSFFGLPQKVYSFESKISALEITSNDIAVYMGIYADKVIELHLDYFGRKTIRELQLFTKEETITADLVHHTVTCGKDGKVISLGDERNAYQKRELCHFLDIIDGFAENDSDIYNALQVLKIAGGTKEYADGRI